jgi:hypothetical protein
MVDTKFIQMAFCLTEYIFCAGNEGCEPGAMEEKFCTFNSPASAEQYCDGGTCTPGTEEIPCAVDLRKDAKMLGIKIQKQGKRGTCSVFAMTHILEYAYARTFGPGYSDLSQEFLNHAANLVSGRTDDGDFFFNVARGYETFGVVTEAQMPYRKKNDFNSFHFGDEIVEAAAANIAGEMAIKGRFIKPLDGTEGLSDEQFNEIIEYLISGVPVAIGRSHSTVIVGYSLDDGSSGGGDFILADNARGGYHKEDFASVKREVRDVYVFEHPVLYNQPVNLVHSDAAL